MQHLDWIKYYLLIDSSIDCFQLIHTFFLLYVRKGDIKLWTGLHTSAETFNQLTVNNYLISVTIR